MNRSIFTIILTLSLIAPGVSQAGPLRDAIQERIEQRRETRPSFPREDLSPRLLKRVEVNGRYGLLYIPDTAGKPYPLVIALHGGGGSAQFMADDAKYGLLSAARYHGYAVLFPNGVGAVGEKFATWNAGGCCGKARDTGSDDVAFIRALVDQVAVSFPLNRNQIYAVGMSNGGMMAHRLACDAADLVSGVASVAGTDATASCNPSRPVPVLHIHALNDDHVQYDGGAGPQAFRDVSKVMDFVSAPETFRRWVKRDACPPTHVSHDFPGGSCMTVSGCSAGSRVRLCSVEDGGHSWPGGGSTRPGKEHPSKALDANEAFWEFFMGR